MTAQSKSLDSTRHILQGVRKVSFWSPDSPWCPEDMGFPSCLGAVLGYLGDTRLSCKKEPRTGQGDACAGCDTLTACRYGMLMSLSGEAFAGSWNLARWDMGNGGVLRIDDDPVAPLRRVMDALGYTYTILGNGSPQAPADAALFPTPTDASTLRAQIVASLQRGHPVIAWGVIGPPEPCVITGYDEGGDILIGWSFFQNFPEFSGQLAFEENGMFRKRDWLPELCGLLLIGERGAQADARTIARDGLENGLTLLRRPLAQGAHAVGIAAYDAWIAALLDDSQVDGVPPEVLQERNGVHQSQAGLIAELRAYGGEWIASTAALFPYAEDELGQAAGCFYREHDRMWRVWEQTGEDFRIGAAPGDPAAIFARRDTRERTVAILREAQADDIEAAAHLEAALARIDAQGEQPGPGNTVRRSVIANVPYIGFDAARTDNAQKNTFFVAALEAGLKVLGDPLPYTLLMGVTGAAFHLAWNTEVWDGGNQVTLTIGEDPVEHIRRAFRAAGWDPYVVGNHTWREMDATTPGAPQRTSVYQRPDTFGDQVEYVDEARFREILISNLRYKRYPVLAYGVQLVPACGIVFGYDEGGDVLIGWNHFQSFEENLAQGKLDFEPDGAFRKRDWYPDTAGLVTFAYKSPKPPLAETYRSALQWAVTVTRTARVRRWHNGLAAYDAWAHALENDAEFDGVSDEAMGVRLMCHNDALINACDGRGEAAHFLRLAAGALPDKAAALTAAADLYDAEVQTLVKLVDVLNGYGYDPEYAQRLGQPDTRARLAAIIREAKGQEETAIARVEEALEV